MHFFTLLGRHGRATQSLSFWLLTVSTAAAAQTPHTDRLTQAHSATFSGPSCATLPDDVLEDNDTCGTAVPLALGLHPNLHVKDSDHDYYSITIPSQSLLDIYFPTGSGDIWMTGFQPCFVQVTGTSSTGFSLANPNAFPHTILFQVRPRNAACADYSLDLTATPDACLSVSDDGFEDFDDCSNPMPLAPGSYANLVVRNEDPDFFAITVGPGERLRCQETSDSFHASYQLWDAGCANSLGSDPAFVETTNTGTQAQTVILEVSQTFAGIPSCSTYAFDLIVEPSPCLAIPDDTLEPNDSCEGPTPVQDGTLLGLQVSAWSPDFYRTCVPAGEWLNVAATFAHAQGDIDVYLFDASDSLCGSILPGADLAKGTSNNDNETLAWFNGTGAALDVVLLVALDRPQAQPCNSYDLTISGAADCVGALITPYCSPMDSNSTGFPTLLVANHGHPAQSGLRLQAILGPPGEFAYFLVGTGASEPGLSIGAGRLCLRTAPPNEIGRFNVNGTPWNSLGQFDGQGIFQNLSGTSIWGSGFDVPTSLPLSGTPTIQLGETWYFQLWHREAQGSSNFSNAVAVRF